MRNIFSALFLTFIIISTASAMISPTVTISIHYDNICREYTVTVYQMHRSTEHTQLLIKRKDIGTFVFRILDDGTTMLLGPFPISPSDNQLLLNIALQQAYKSGCHTLHASPMYARETPETAIKIFEQNGFVFDQEHKIYRLSEKKL